MAELAVDGLGDANGSVRTERGFRGVVDLQQ